MSSPGPTTGPGRSELREGDIVADRYCVLRKISDGGMGTVYLAQHTLIERLVAIKVLSPEFAMGAEGTSRFLQEARSAAKLVHDNIIAVHDFGETDNSLFIVMEYLEGKDLSYLLGKDEPLHPERIRHILLQTCSALAAAHAAGIVHRDLKPENIFITQRADKQDVVKLLDFGVAQVLHEEPKRERLTRAGSVIGTPEYMAPEQVTGEPLDARADVYALGCILYEMLAGAPPFAGSSATVIMAQRLYEHPVPPGRRVQWPVSPVLEAVCLKAMERDREHRFQTMREMMAALQVTDGEAAALPGPKASQGVPVGGSLGEPPPELPSGGAAPGPVPEARAVLVRQRRAWPLVLLGSGVSAAIALTVTLRLSDRGAARPEGRPAATAAQAAAGTPAPQATAARAPAGPAPAAPRPALAADSKQPLPRLRIRDGTVGAQVHLNGRQLLGRVPLDVAIPMMVGLDREAAFVVVSKAPCTSSRFDVLLQRGATHEQAAELDCPRAPGQPAKAPRKPDPQEAAKAPPGERPRPAEKQAPEKQPAEKQTAEKQAAEKPAPAEKPITPTSDSLRNPF